MNGAATETQTSPDYRFENLGRSPERGFCLVVQRTLSGRGWIRDGRRIHFVDAGHAMLFTHDEDTAYGYPEGDAEPYRLQWMSISGGWLRPFYEDLRAARGPVVRMQPGGEAAELLDECVRGFYAGRLTDPVEVFIAGSRLLGAIAEEQALAEGALDRVELARQIAAREFARGLNLKQLAQRVGLSREHLTRAFTRRHGESPGRLLRRLRLERARSLLSASTRMPIADIAAACGFSSPQAFSRACRPLRNR